MTDLRAGDRVLVIGTTLHRGRKGGVVEVERDDVGEGATVWVMLDGFRERMAVRSVFLMREVTS